MTIETILQLISKTITIALLISAPMLLTALVVGLIISILQSVTQIQEMTLTFIPKILATFLVLILTLPWMIQILNDFIIELFESIPNLIG